MATAKFCPGFRRLTPLDVVILVASAVGVPALWAETWWYGLVVGIVVAHFFLFCNVFRVSRPLELLWAGAFIALATATILWDTPGWWPTAAASVCVAAIVVAVEMQKPSYHGIGWRRINPELPKWWATHATEGLDAGPATGHV